MSRNVNELKLVLLAGVYRFNVDVVTGGLPPTLQQCLSYSMAIFLQRQDHVDKSQTISKMLMLRRLVQNVFSKKGKPFWFEQQTRLAGSCQFALHTLPRSFVRGAEEAHLQIFSHPPAVLMRVHGDGFPFPEAGESRWHWFSIFLCHFFKFRISRDTGVGCQLQKEHNSSADRLRHEHVLIPRAHAFRC